MQYRRTFAILSLAVLAPAYVARAEAPAMQPMVRLQNFGTLVSFMNLGLGTVRVVVILEPSAESSERALGAVKSLLAANPSKRLRAYVVWSRVGTADTEARALTASTRVQDRRLVYLWDDETAVANSFREVLNSRDRPATGVVLLYDTDARLALAPPAPSLWMSVNPRLAGAALDATSLGTRANAMVRHVEAKVANATQSKH